MKSLPEETYQRYLYNYYFKFLYFKRFKIDCFTLADLWLQSIEFEIHNYDCLFNIPVNEN